MPAGTEINSMFGRIAGRYDFTNLLLSGGLCRGWTRRLAREVKRAAPANAVVADLATGSGDVAFALARAMPGALVRGYDFCEPMLEVARRRMAEMSVSAGNTAAAAAAPLAARLHFAQGDCMALPLADASVDAVTIAYGVRNFEDRPAGLREIHRVLRPGGAAFVLEFSQPRPWFRPFYFFYLRHLLPCLARLATGDKKAYDYLAGSIEKFPAREAFSQELRDAGFARARAIGLTAGIVAIHHAEKSRA
jgi:demethylmenaquinone methyltransferase/2-methoxy-6-polyprenyl-1,4-benzoquinol methylase